MPGAAIYEDGPDGEDRGGDPEDDGTPAPAGEDEQGNLRFYNPNQDPEQRRRLRATLRDHHRLVDGESESNCLVCVGNIDTS
tara:strand:- start:6234 stop:6479 length:246 start_codon:yes stop_codon:yes gene_type:complete